MKLHGVQVGRFFAYALASLLGFSSLIPMANIPSEGEQGPFEKTIRQNMPDGLKGLYNKWPDQDSSGWALFIQPLVNNRGSLSPNDAKFLKRLIESEFMDVNKIPSFGLGLRVQQFVSIINGIKDDIISASDKQNYNNFVKYELKPYLQALANKAPKSDIIGKIKAIKANDPDIRSQLAQIRGLTGPLHVRGEQYTPEEQAAFKAEVLDYYPTAIDPKSSQQMSLFASIIQVVIWTEVLPDPTKALFNPNDRSLLVSLMESFVKKAKDVINSPEINQEFITAVQNAFSSTSGDMGAKIAAIGKAINANRYSNEATGLVVVDFLKNTVFPAASATNNFWMIEG